MSKLDEDHKEKRFVRRQLKIKETSFVDKGANQGAHVLLIKNSENTLENLLMTDLHKEASKFKEALAVQNFDEVRESMDKMMRAFSSAVFNIMFDSEVVDKKGMVQGVLDDFSAAMDGLTPLLTGEMVGKMDVEKILSLFESFEKEASAVDKETQAKLDEMQKRLDTLGDENNTLKAANEDLTKQLAEAVEKANGTGEDKGITGVDKSAMTPEVKEYVNGLEKKASDSDNRITKLETAEKVRKIHVDLDKADKVPFDKDQMTDLLVKLDPEDRTVICEVLTKADALIKAGGTSELGSSQDEETTENTALAKLNSKAEEIKLAHPELTIEKAFVEATKKLPDVYKEYRFGRQAVQANVN